MPNLLPLKEEDLVKAIRWRLGIPADADTRFVQEISAKVIGDADLTTRLCKAFAELFEQAVRRKLGTLVTASLKDDGEFLDGLWKVFVDWLKEGGAKHSPLVARMLFKAVKGKK